MILKDPNFCFLGLEDYINITWNPPSPGRWGRGNFVRP